jgi:hypothetical protein
MRMEFRFVKINRFGILTEAGQGIHSIFEILLVQKTA